MNEEKVNILFVDDDKEFIIESKKMLQPLGDVHYDEGYSEPDFYSLYKPGKYNAIILDLRLKSGYEGMELLEYALNEDPAAPIIVLTGYASIETAIKSLKLGAKDYLEKQYLKEEKFKTEFLKKVNRIIIEDKARKMAYQLTADTAAGEQVIGNDIKIKRIVKLVDKFAESKESPILLVGEIGTGKEQVARYVHKRSDAKGHFIQKTIHPEEKDQEKKLFGDDKSPGLIKDAQAGVLFLDDIFNLDFTTQESLLDYIDTGVLKKPGKKQGQTVKVQLILSTCNSSEHILKNKNIYSNFYYRVKTPEILIPPLRERGDDIVLLTRFYLEELKNIIELSGMNAKLDNDKVIKAGHLPGALQQNAVENPGSAQINLEKILAETTLKYMETALKKSNGAKIEAYKYLGYPESKRGTLHTKFQKFFITYPDLVGRFPGIYKLYMEKVEK